MSSGHSQFDERPAGRRAGICRGETRAGARAPVMQILNKNAGVAQLVEQLICNQQVGGSIPSTSSIFFVPYQIVTVDSCAVLAQNTRLDFWRGSRVAKGGRL